MFAPHPTGYVWWNGAFTSIAGWLAEMGVEVKGLGLIAYWQVEVEGGSGGSGTVLAPPARGLRSGLFEGGIDDAKFRMD